MSGDARNFKAPFISQQQCWAKADKFRQEYWPSGEIPVDVLVVAEFDLGLEIRTITRNMDCWNIMPTSLLGGFLFQ